MTSPVVKHHDKSYNTVSGRRIDGFVAPTLSHEIHANRASTDAIRKTNVQELERNTHHEKSNTAKKTTGPGARGRPTGQHTKPHPQQKSKTLMRKAVAKPTPSFKRQVNVKYELTHANKQIIEVKNSAIQVDPIRFRHAQRVEKHPQVHRFHAPAPVKISVAAIPVRQAPVHTNAPQKDAKTPHYQSVGFPDAPQRSHSAKQSPSKSTGTSLFEQAIQNANHYVDIAGQKKHHKKKARRHALSMAAGIASLMLIGGFMTYINTPSLQIKVAGIQAGVATSTPNFAASGFSFNGVESDKNKRIFTLTNGSGNFTLTQEATSWTNTQMIEQVASINADGTLDCRKVPVGDNTAYRFDNSGAQATWVKDGTWYQLTGNQSISDDQLKALVKNS